MENEKTINEKIIAITRKIQEQHPELIPFLNEMPVTIPDDSDPEINTRILREYYESLETMLTKHPDKTSK